MSDAKSRARVQRLLGGGFRPDDLTGLFLYARDRCDGREPVAEIGHFVAHHHEREKGITTRATREWYAVARFHGVKFGPGGPYALHSDKLPSETSDYLRAAARRMDGKHLRRDAGVSRAEAHNILSKLADRLTKNPNGTYALPSDITKTEQICLRW